MRVVILIATAAVACCSIAHAEPAIQSDADVRIRWLRDCGSGSEQVYFSLEVRHDGLVRYDGQNGTKVIGVRESPIGAADARRLRAKVESFVWERKPLKDSEKEFNLEYFCLEAALLRGSEPVATNARRQRCTHLASSLAGDRQANRPAEVGVPGESRVRAGPADERLLQRRTCCFSLTLGGRRSIPAKPSPIS